MTAEYQAAMISFVQAYGEFVKAWAKIQQARAKASRRRR